MKNLIPFDPDAIAKKAGIELYFTLLMLTFLGLLILALSIVVVHQTGNVGMWGYLSEFLKELGIVLVAVCTVSVIYELIVARKHYKQFLRLLREQIERGEGNTAACADLGIAQVFRTRDAMEKKKPIRDLILSLPAGAKIRVVGQSLLHLMNTPEVLQKAIEHGVELELCLLNPDSPDDLLKKHPDMVRADIELVVELFKRHIIDWCSNTLPRGRVELCFHEILLVDSYLSITSPRQEQIVWDWGFGRGHTSHRVLVVEPDKPLGIDLSNRYDRIYEQSQLFYQYPKAPPMLPEAAPDIAGQISPD